MKRVVERPGPGIFTGQGTRGRGVLHLAALAAGVHTLKVPRPGRWTLHRYDRNRIEEVSYPASDRAIALAAYVIRQFAGARNAIISTQRTSLTARGEYVCRH
jgi:hypothetical protein